MTFLIPETRALELVLVHCALALGSIYIFPIFIFSHVFQVSVCKGHFLFYCFSFNNSILHFYGALERVLLKNLLAQGDKTKANWETTWDMKNTTKGMIPRAIKASSLGSWQKI